MSNTDAPITVGRYLLHREIARGGMATIHIARLLGDVGFSRIVAAKRLHPELAEDDELVKMFLDEARIASKVHHRNVVPVLDVVTMGEEVVLVQDYVHGAPLSWLLRAASQAGDHVPIAVAVSIASQVLAGLHAAHETLDEMGSPLDIVHRDVSPQNVMLATDGTARLLDFGVAKVAMAAHVTRAGTFKGKLAYSAPEQIRGAATRQSDIYSLSVVLWELLAGRRLRAAGKGEDELIMEILAGTPPMITEALAGEQAWLGPQRWEQLEALAPVIRKGLATDARRRWLTAAEMEQALIGAVTPATSTEVAAWLKSVGKDFLDGRDRVIAAEEASWRRSTTRQPTPTELPACPATEPAISLRWSVLLRRGPAAITAIASALVIALVFGVAFVVHDLSASSPAPAIRPTAAHFVEPPPEATVSRPPPLPAPAPPPPVVVVEPPVVEHHAAPSPVRHIMRAPPPPRPAPHAPAAPPPPRVVAPPPAPPPPAKPSCAIPYYFEGSKKIFKASCI